MKDFWDERYGRDEMAYGLEPNGYFKSNIQNIDPGKLLLPAEGEGRNAVYAAKLGWEVTAFDLSKEGKAKAVNLAESNNVEIDYRVGEFRELQFPEKEFDAIALVYAHFPASVKSEYHKVISGYLKPEGFLIFEAFSKSHLKFNSVNPSAGGPKDIDMLFSMEEIENDFSGYDILELSEKEIELHEGVYHNGMSSVIRFFGRKKD